MFVLLSAFTKYFLSNGFSTFVRRRRVPVSVRNAAAFPPARSQAA
jgi:hypothetical protein